MVTPRPRILGPQTAIVVGPSGEEIYTDEYGRIKVQFFWDREGKNDETAGCFIRVVQAGAGQGWGSFALPRIGQEVVVDFLDGDPDRPLVTGAVYNATNTVPEALPANKTQFGLKTRITKGGGGYNRLWFEDKKDSEVVWFRAERDYKANIVNKDEERQYDKGNRKTTFMEGNDELVITKGTRTETIEGDDKKTIKTGGLTDLVETGDETHTVKTGKRTTTINADETLEVKTGNRSTTIKMGNDALKVSLGNVTIKVDVGKHSTEAMQSIELTCGPSKIKLDPTQISLEALMVKIEAKTMLQLKGLMVQSEASAMSILKGGIVMVN
jgi:type VI secretion system secreted protein VgrG